ncbi:MAG: universal stress protein [Ktedonobacteraceae bacterium]|nr:universal stress protein [Ktedonobacteraceae bacterium]
MFKRIIVPLDGSSRAEQALPVAARIARASGGSLHLLQVISPVVDYGGLTPVPMLTEQSTMAEMAQSTGYLTSFATLPMMEGIQITTEAVFGAPARQILEVAGSRGTNLIVLCSHGRSGFTRWALGSVAHQLVHHSSIPMLVLREHEVNSLLSHGDDAQTLRTIVPLDGSELAESALWPAAYLTSALAAPAQGALHLVQVVKIFPATAEEGFISELNEEALQRARAYLMTTMEHIHATMKDLKLFVTSSVEYERDVTSTLVNVAEQKSEGQGVENAGSCNLIAISTHGRNGLQRLIMGSVTDRLLSTTKGPMLIVRPPKVGKLLNEEKHTMKQKNDNPELAYAGSSWVGLL